MRRRVVQQVPDVELSLRLSRPRETAPECPEPVDCECDVRGLRAQLREASPGEVTQPDWSLPENGYGTPQENGDIHFLASDAEGNPSALLVELDADLCPGYEIEWLVEVE